MSVNKLIKFYILKPEPCLNNASFLQNTSDSISYQIFKSAFPEENFYRIDIDKRTLYFDIKTYSKNHIFGTCSVKEALKATSFIQQRNKETLQAKPFTELNDENQLEAYTFFYVDFIHNRMAAIANKKIPQIHNVLMQTIWENSHNLSQISIQPELIQDVKKEAEKLVNPSWLEIEFASPPSSAEIPKMDLILNEPDFKSTKYRVKIKIEKTNKKFIDKIMQLGNKKDEDHISMLKLIGKNELGLDETFNFIESLYAKTVPLELTDDTVKNIAYIEENLKKYLDKHTLELA